MAMMVIGWGWLFCWGSGVALLCRDKFGVGFKEPLAG
jgi:hypothetical protein